MDPLQKAHVPRSPGVHHPGLLEDGKEFGGLGQGLPGRRQGAFQDVLQTIPLAPSPAALATVRMVPSTGRITAR